MNKGKVVLIILAGVATVGLAYVGYRLVKKSTDKKAAKADCEKNDGTWDGNDCKAKETTTPTANTYNTTPASRNDNFPLKFGSLGAKVGALQTALNKLGADLIVDNDFGKLTEAALQKYYKVTSADEATYNKVIAGEKTLPNTYNVIAANALFLYNTPSYTGVRGLYFLKGNKIGYVLKSAFDNAGEVDWLFVKSVNGQGYTQKKNIVKA